jgi:glutathione S-transferase
LKNIGAEHVPVHLVRGGGEQHSSAYRTINPQERVPSLVLDDGRVLTQSPAIIEYLDEIVPEPPLFACRRVFTRQDAIHCRDNRM